MVICSRTSFSPRKASTFWYATEARADSTDSTGAATAAVTMRVNGTNQRIVFMNRLRVYRASIGQVTGHTRRFSGACPFDSHTYKPQVSTKSELGQFGLWPQLAPRCATLWYTVKPF